MRQDFGSVRPAAFSRAFLYRTIRDFFAARDVVEVETPVLSSAGNTDPQLESFRTDGQPPAWLRTSPEFFHKRLLAQHGFDLFEIGKAFRQGESSTRHNPEFSLLEWYRLGFTMTALMQEVEQLLQTVYAAFRKNLQPPQFFRYGEVFAEHTGLSPFTASLAHLQAACRSAGYSGQALERDHCLDLLFSLQVQPQLPQDCAVFVSHYPASQAALAQLDPENNQQALRFECFVDGLELANGYQELTDPAEQLRRFEADASTRQRNGLVSVPPDEKFLAALHHGLPACSGVALGLDRLLMLVTGAASIDEVLWFSWADS